MTVVKPELQVQEEDQTASTSSEEKLSTFGGEMAGACNEEVPISSTGAVQFSFGEEKLRTLRAPISSTDVTQFPVWEEEGQTSHQFGTLSEVIQGPLNMCSMEIRGPPAPFSYSETTQLTGNEVRMRTSEQLTTLLEVMKDVIGGLENLCLLEDRHGAHARRSPLPLWYPRRPLQDITAVLNIGSAQPEENSNFKKGSKKAQTAQVPGPLYDNRGVFGQQRAPRLPFKPRSLVPAASATSSLLRKGFR